jgi:hypothetical protein
LYLYEACAELDQRTVDEGKRCSFFKILDMLGERRGPCIGEADR